MHYTMHDYTMRHTLLTMSFAQVETDRKRERTEGVTKGALFPSTPKQEAKLQM